MHVMADDGAVAAQGEVGHLQVHGSIVFERYHNNQEATVSAFTEDGWFITGDQAFLDDAGDLNLSGRVKESIIINGVQYYPHQIEAALEDVSLPGAVPSLFACFAHRPSGSETERFCVVFSPTYGKDSVAKRVETNDAIARVSALICGARPYQIIPLDKSQLPKSALGKLSRTKIKVAFEAGAYDDVLQEHLSTIHAYRIRTRQDRTLTETEKRVLSTFLDVLGLDPQEVGVETNMLEAGITSIDLLRMQKVLQTQFSFAEIPLITLLTNPTIEGMAAAIDQTKCLTTDIPKAYNPVVPMGTMLAFEMAKRFEAQGEQVNLLGSFNLPPHIKMRMKQLDWIEVALNLSCFLDLYSEEYQAEISLSMHEMENQEVLNFVMEKAPQARLAQLSLTRAKLQRWISLAHAMHNAACEYELSGSVAGIDVFYCTPLASVGRDRQRWLEEYLSKWVNFSREEPRFHEVEGAHYTMLDAENVRSFQAKLKAVLVERGG